MKQISLTKGKFALVDDEDFEELNQYKWYAYCPHQRSWYTLRKYPHPSLKNKYGQKKQITVMMHRQILGMPEGKNIDHRDGNGLNNQKNNIRLCTQTQNSWNRRRYNPGYKGVLRIKNSYKWDVKITANGITHYLGCYTCPKTAAREYDKLAKILHGEFACLNFPDAKA